MKILRDTPDQLILENNPVLPAILLGCFSLVFIAIGLFNYTQDISVGISFGLAGLAIGVIFTAVFIRRTQLILDHPRNLVEQRSKSMLGYTRRTWDLHDLDRAIVQSSQGDDTTTYRIALVFVGGMDAGTHPVTQVYTSGPSTERAAETINRWLAATTLDSARATP